MKQKLAEWFNLIYGFRKTLAWFFLFVVGIVFRLKDYIDGAQFIDLMKATFAGFVAGNALEHVVSFGKDYVASKGAAAPQVADADESNDNKDVTPVVEG